MCRTLKKLSFMLLVKLGPFVEHFYTEPVHKTTGISEKFISAKSSDVVNVVPQKDSF